MLARRADKHARSISFAIKKLSHLGKKVTNVNISISDVYTPFIPAPSALRNSAIILKYLLIWYIWHTWKAVNKIKELQWKTLRHYLEVQGLKSTGPSGCQKRWEPYGRHTLQPPCSINVGVGASRRSLTSTGPTANSEQTSLSFNYLSSASFLQTLGRVPSGGNPPASSKGMKSLLKS